MAENRFHGAGPQLVVLPSAGMPQAPDRAGGSRILVYVPGPLGRATSWPAGVFGQWREQPELVLLGASEVVLADVPGVGEHGAQLRTDPGLGQLLAAGVRSEGR